MKTKFMFFTLILSSIIVLCFNVYAEDPYLDQLDIEAQLFKNGDMLVSETWHVSFSDTELHVGFKKIPLKGITSIEGIKVTSNNQNFEYVQYPFKKQNTTYIGRVGTYSTYEHDGYLWIEWYINEYDAKRDYTISYTVKDIVTLYKDTAELYWQFVGEDFELNIKKVTGKVTIPQGGQFEDFLVWAHGPLNGTITKVSESVTEFKAKDLQGNMLEVRLAMPTKLFPNAKTVDDRDYLNTIIAEEQEWADKANQRRMMMRIVGYFDLGFGIAFLLAGIIVIILLNKKYKRHIPADNVDYYRDIPDSTMTPATASHLYYFYNISNKKRGNNVSSSILELARRRLIYFDEIEEKNKKVTAIILNKEKKELKELGEDLKSIYGLVVSACGAEGYVTLKGLEKYTTKNATKVKGYIDSMENISKANFVERHFLDTKSDMTKTILLTISFVVLFMSFVAIFALNFIIIYAPLGALIGSIICLLFSFSIKRLNEEGEQQYKYWNAFGKFIDDFSLMKEQEIPKLVMWEEYMVYATMMGKAEKAAKQLKVVYKELSDPEFYRMNSSSYLFYFMYFNGRHNSFESISSFTNTLNNINNSATRIASSNNTSSGKGFGGGFSGGGGGGHGGGGGGFR